jgi:hypothetical protein
MLDLGRHGRRLDALVAALPAGYTNSGLNLPGFALEPIRASGRGFYTHLYHHLFDAPGLTIIRRMEALREELVPMLAAVGQPVGARMSAYIHEAPTPVELQECDYAPHYGETLRAQVAECDAEIIQTYGYRFDG